MKNDCRASHQSVVFFFKSQPYPLKVGVKVPQIVASVSDSSDLSQRRQVHWRRHKPGLEAGLGLGLEAGCVLGRPKPLSYLHKYF